MTVTLDEITTHVRYVDVVLRNSGFPPAEAAAMRADMDTFLATTIPQALGDLTDVDTATTPPADGDTLVYVLADDEWVPGTVSGAVSMIEGQAEVLIMTDARRLLFGNGLTPTQSGTVPERAIIQPEYGGTGTEDLIARSDHYHTTDTVTRVTTSASGYLSSGTRSLGSTNVTLLSGITYVVEAEVKGQFRGADAGAAYYRLSLTVNGNTRQSPSMGFWAVQGVPDKYTWDHERTIAGTGAAITVSASVAYESGAGFNVDYSELKITLRPRS